MPSVPDEFIPFEFSRPVRPQEPEPEGPGLLGTLAAGGEVANWVYRSWRHVSNRAGLQDDPEHDPFAMIRGTPYAADPERFAGSGSEEETRAIMREWDADTEAKQVLARSGWGGTLAAISMGMLDPTIFVPVAAVASGAARGANTLRIGADVALTAGATAALGEAAMLVTTPEMTGQDAALNVGVATLLGGFLGTGAGALLSRAERRQLEAVLTADRLALAEDTAPARPASPASAGAAAADTRELQMRRVPGLSALPDPAGKAAPTRRVLNTPFPSARRALVDLAETPYIFEENLKGVATTQGGALDRTARIEMSRARIKIEEEFTRLYTDFRQQSGANVGPVAGRVDRLIGRNFADWKAMVDDALRNGDTHEIPQVAEAARIYRETVFRPWTERAQAAGLLPEELDVKTAESYMMRNWNKERLVGERPEVVRTFAGWLEEEELKKVALQDRLRETSAALSRVDAELQKLSKARADDEFAVSERARLDSRRTALLTRIEEDVAAWEGRSAREAQRAMRQADEGRMARAAAGGAESRIAPDLNKEVETAVRRILDSERITDRQELESLANEIIDRITGTPDGRLPYDAGGGGGAAAAMAGRGDARGPLAARVFMIPDNRVRQWLNTDPQETAEIFLNTMVPDVLLTERFGDVNMTEVMRRISEEASQMEMAAKTPKERLAIQAQRDSAIADLAAIRDRIRHTYGFSSDPRQRFLGRMAQTAGRYSVVTNLGGVVLSSLPDLAGTQWRFGMTSAFRNAWVPYAKALFSPETRKAVMAQKRQLQTLGIAADTFLATRQSALYEVGESYRPQSRFERGVKWGADKFQLASGLSYWTDFAKLASGMVASAEALAAVRAVASGKPKARQIRNLAEGGVDAAMASRIVRQLKADGAVDVVDGIEIPNTGNWTDRGARNAFEALITRDVDMMVLTPGQEKALMFSKPIGGLILQFKSFVQAANERLLVRSLQARDIEALQGMASAVALGVMAEVIYSWIVGRDLPENPANIIKSGVERSGLLGWYQEANSLSAKFSGGSADVFRLAGADRPDSRYISRSVLGAFLGPTANKFEDLVRVTGTAANLDWSAADTRRLRRMVPGQNLFYIRRRLDELEGNVNEAFGITPLKK